MRPNNVQEQEMSKPGPKKVPTSVRKGCSGAQQQDAPALLAALALDSCTSGTEYERCVLRAAAHASSFESRNSPAPSVCQRSTTPLARVRK